MQLIFISYLNSYQFQIALYCCGFILVSISSFTLIFKMMVDILLLLLPQNLVFYLFSIAGSIVEKDLRLVI